MGLDLSRTLRNIDELVRMKEEKHSKLKIRLSMVVRQDNALMAERITENYKDKAEIRLIKLGEWIGYNAHKEDNETIESECDDLFHQICFLSNGDFSLCCFDANGIVGKNIQDCSIIEGFYSALFEKTRDMQILRGRKGFCSVCSFS